MGNPEAALSSPSVTTGRVAATRTQTPNTRRWWIALVVVVVGSFAVLLGLGRQIDTDKPPIPAKVLAGGQQLMTGDDIVQGQQIWQSLGGQEIGSVWGHGAYVAPDWTADWLHREAVWHLDTWARQGGAASYEALGAEQQEVLKARLKTLLRTNTYDPASGTVTLDPQRAAAWRANSDYYAKLFADGHNNYAIARGTLTDRAQAQQMADFFWWTAWSAATNRPGNGPVDGVSYTQNWPHEPLIDNVPPADNILWSIVSFILLLAGIAAMVFYHSSLQDRSEEPDPAEVPEDDPLLGYRSTPSQRATLKYFFVVGLLFVLQIAMGIIGAHYGVEGNQLYGIQIDQFLPYAVVRTWHTQLGIFWIATAWLATGLYVAPAVGGVEPRLQRAGVNVLFGALLVVVLGSMAGEYLSITGRLGRFALGMMKKKAQSLADEFAANLRTQLEALEGAAAEVAPAAVASVPAVAPLSWWRRLLLWLRGSAAQHPSQG